MLLDCDYQIQPLILELVAADDTFQFTKPYKYLFLSKL